MKHRRGLRGRNAVAGARRPRGRAKAPRAGRAAASHRNQAQEIAHLRQEHVRLAGQAADLQAALTAARAHHEDLLSSLQDAVIVVGPAGDVVQWNPAAEELFKVSASTALGKPFGRVLPQAEALRALLTKALGAGRSHADFDVDVARPDGSRIAVSAVASILAGAGGEPRGAVLALRDVSRLRELEEQLRRSDRLVALGQMAAGVAHEVRNPLLGIRAAAQLQEGDPAFTAPLREYTGVIIREVDRLNAIVEDLLAFASPKPVQLRPCNLNQVLEETLALEGAALAAASVSVTRLYDPELPLILGDPPRLHQVFLNLLRNAAEAMPGGGAITVRTRFERRSARLGGQAAAVAEVADAGTGIAPEVARHLFNPFFTTKPRGTGLGLTICLRIAEDHGGAIELAEQGSVAGTGTGLPAGSVAGTGRGATFAVLLPLAPAAGGPSDA